MGPVTKKNRKELPQKGSGLIGIKKRKRTIRASRDMNFLNEWQISVCVPNDVKQEKTKAKGIEKPRFHIDLQEDIETPARRRNKDSTTDNIVGKNAQRNFVYFSTPAKDGFPSPQKLIVNDNMGNKNFTPKENSSSVANVPDNLEPSTNTKSAVRRSCRKTTNEKPKEEKQTTNSPKKLRSAFKGEKSFDNEVMAISTDLINKDASNDVQKESSNIQSPVTNISKIEESTTSYDDNMIHEDKIFLKKIRSAHIRSKRFTVNNNESQRNLIFASDTGKLPLDHIIQEDHETSVQNQNKDSTTDSSVDKSSQVNFVNISTPAKTTQKITVNDDMKDNSFTPREISLGVANVPDNLESSTNTRSAVRRSCRKTTNEKPIEEKQTTVSPKNLKSAFKGENSFNNEVIAESTDLINKDASIDVQKESSNIQSPVTNISKIEESTTSFDDNMIQEDKIFLKKIRSAHIRSKRFTVNNRESQRNLIFASDTGKLPLDHIKQEDHETSVQNQNKDSTIDSRVDKSSRANFVNISTPAKTTQKITVNDDMKDNSFTPKEISSDLVNITNGLKSSTNTRSAVRRSCRKTTNEKPIEEKQTTNSPKNLRSAFKGENSFNNEVIAESTDLINKDASNDVQKESSSIQSPVTNISKIEESTTSFDDNMIQEDKIFLKKIRSAHIRSKRFTVNNRESQRNLIFASDTGKLPLDHIKQEDHETSVQNQNKDSTIDSRVDKSSRANFVNISTPVKTTQKITVNDDMKDNSFTPREISLGVANVTDNLESSTNARSAVRRSFRKATNEKPIEEKQTTNSPKNLKSAFKEEKSFDNEVMIISTDLINKDASNDVQKESSKTQSPMTNISKIEESTTSFDDNMIQEDEIFLKKIKRSHKRGKRFTVNNRESQRNLIFASNTGKLPLDHIIQEDHETSVQNQNKDSTTDDIVDKSSQANFVNIFSTPAKTTQKITVNDDMKDNNFTPKEISLGVANVTDNLESSINTKSAVRRSCRKTTNETPIEEKQTTSSLKNLRKSVCKSDDGNEISEDMFVVDDCKKTAFLEVQKETCTDRRSTYKVDFENSHFALNEINVKPSTPKTNGIVCKLTPSSMRRTDQCIKRRKSQISNFETPVVMKKRRVTEFNDSSIIFRDSMLRTSSPFSCTKNKKNRTHELDETINSPAILKDNEIGLPMETKKNRTRELEETINSPVILKNNEIKQHESNILLTDNEILQKTETSTNFKRGSDELPIKNSTNVTMRHKIFSKVESVELIENTGPPDDLFNMSGVIPTSGAMSTSNSLIEFEENERRVKKRSSSLSLTPEKKPLRKSSLNFLHTPKDTIKANLYKKVLSQNLKSAQKVIPFRTKMPNFALIHQKAAEQMEDIEQHQKRKAERAKLLMSGNKPKQIVNKENTSKIPIASVMGNEKLKSTSKSNLHLSVDNKFTLKNDRCRNLFKNSTDQNQSNRSENLEVSTSSKSQKSITKPSTFKPVQYVHMKVNYKPPEFGAFDNKPTSIKVNLKPKNEARKDLIKAVATKTKVRKPTISNQREVVKGVRSNRRFELLMKMRQT